MGNFKLDKEEKEILDLFRRNSLRCSDNVKQEIALTKKSASKHMKKSALLCGSGDPEFNRHPERL